jgi:hypothetical protein
LQQGLADHNPSKWTNFHLHKLKRGGIPLLHELLEMRFCLSPMLSGFTIFLSGKDLDMVSTSVSAQLLNEVLNEVLLRRPGKK